MNIPLDFVSGNIHRYSGPVHTYPDIFESATFSFRIRLSSTRIRRIRKQIRKFLNPLSRVEIFESDNISDTCGRSNPDIFWYDDVKIGASVYLANLNTAADRRQRASVLLELISSLLTCMQQNVALLNAEISYARRRLDICKLFTLSTGQNGRQKQLKRVGKQCRPRRFWVRPGRTSTWWDNFVNRQWIRSESEYVWTGEFDMNTLWSYNVWTRIFSYPERKSCGFKNIRIRVDGASLRLRRIIVVTQTIRTVSIDNRPLVGFYLS